MPTRWGASLEGERLAEADRLMPDTTSGLRYTRYRSNGMESHSRIQVPIDGLPRFRLALRKQQRPDSPVCRVVCLSHNEARTGVSEVPLER